jgi:hypothetical protein
LRAESVVGIGVSPAAGGSPQKRIEDDAPRHILRDAILQTAEAVNQHRSQPLMLRRNMRDYDGS